jgi:CubicO group peptidase (beta-lactamase class C family)
MGELDGVGEIISGAVASGGIPGVVAAAGRGPVTLGTWTAGLADTTPGARRPMTPGTVFDLASLTKVVSTTTITLSLAAAGDIRLDDPVGRYLPAAPWDVTVRQLLAHSSGLPGSVKFYEWCATRDELLGALYATPLEAPPGTGVDYSDLGFMTLGEMISSVTGSPLDAAFRDLVSGPLGMAGTCFGPAGPPELFAATEFRDDGTPWTGIVHDENARVMGGVAGHAGVFAPVANLARFAAWWVSSADGPVPAALRREAETCQTPGLLARQRFPSQPAPTDHVPPTNRPRPTSRPASPDRPPGGRRGLGWVRPGDRFDILAGAWPETAVSHTGFTGTSIALDSASGAWLVLLTNRVQFGRDVTAIRALRRAVHIAAAEALIRSPER